MKKRMLILAMCLGIAVSSISGCASAREKQEVTKVSQETVNEEQKKDDEKKEEWIENPIPEEQQAADGVSLPEAQKQLNLIKACEPLNLTVEQKLEDYDFFWKEVQDKVYCLDDLAKDRDIDLEKHIKSYRERVKNSQDDYEFYDILSKSASFFGGVWHTTLKTPYSVLSEGVYHPRSDEVQNAVFSDTNASKLKYWDILIQKKDNNYKMSKSQAIVEAKMPELKIINDKVAVIELSSFYYPSNEKQVEEVLVDMMKQVSDYEHVIFDLKMNGGGNNQFALRTLLSSNIDQPLKYSELYFFKDGEEVRRSVGPGTKIVEANYDYTKAKYYPIVPLEKLPEEMKIVEGDYGNADSYQQLDFEFQPRFQKKILQGKIWVLTYPKNYSASENFIRICKATGFATLVGNQTSGDGLAILPRYFVLPNSGLVGTVTATWALNEDGTCNSNEGTRPDIESPEGETALETCLKAIEEYEKENK